MGASRLDLCERSQLEDFIKRLVNEIKFLRSAGSRTYDTPKESHTNAANDEEVRSLRNDIAQLRTQLTTTHVHMAQLLEIPDHSEFVKSVFYENESLRIENAHLRELLRLATHDYQDTIKRTTDELHHSGHASADSSILLTTPPRSPPLEHGFAQKHPSRRNISSKGLRGAVSNIREGHIPAPTIALHAFDDIADVGPPLSPPPSSSSRHIVTKPSVDPCDASDSAEASAGSHEVDQDLATYVQKVYVSCTV